MNDLSGDPTLDPAERAIFVRGFRAGIIEALHEEQEYKRPDDLPELEVFHRGMQAGARAVLSAIRHEALRIKADARGVSPVEALTIARKIRGEG